MDAGPVLARKRGGENKFRFFLVVWGKFVVEEVVTQGESVAVPIKRVEGSKSAFPDSGNSGKKNKSNTKSQRMS